MSEQKRNVRRSIVGTVTSDKMDKTIKVEVNVSVKHPKYEKRVNRRSVFAAHDEKNEAKSGDLVEIEETRKLSKTKCFRLVKVLKNSN
ncbi:30S ribosomal protein S17 [Planctomycetales bacterium]|jgi:small subunit ribosomal protein S17|nr:30S ribosomal protein S17 [Planctomycetota bacterium]GHS92210.1 30S ribosomal protein S17 [Planctomycetales bacterium]GHS99752.1 30S ribosomal protein S17 [Planctomycetales bacterium]GHT07257.1 30S ribosomal protein S17 [Planctomycetales bacterium]GHV18517.1 30S ribosomal protein S17 [Planctomycetales bacterium]